MASDGDFINRLVVSAEGVRLGRVDAVIYDPDSDLSWLLVRRVSLLGARHTLVPHTESIGPGALRSEVSAEAVRSSPQLLSPDALASGQSLSPWYRHYASFGHRWPRERSQRPPYVVEVRHQRDLRLEPGQGLGPRASGRVDPV